MGSTLRKEIFKGLGWSNIDFLRVDPVYIIYMLDKK